MLHEEGKAFPSSLHVERFAEVSGEVHLAERPDADGAQDKSP